MSRAHLLGVADDEVDLRHVAEGLGLRLGGAAGDDQFAFGFARRSLRIS
jgi:hypothetical protein